VLTLVREIARTSNKTQFECVKTMIFREAQITSKQLLPQIKGACSVKEYPWIHLAIAQLIGDWTWKVYDYVDCLVPVKITNVTTGDEFCTHVEYFTLDIPQGSMPSVSWASSKVLENSIQRIGAQIKSDLTSCVNHDIACIIPQYILALESEGITTGPGFTRINFSGWMSYCYELIDGQRIHPDDIE
jgi:hypothetical protein